MTSTDDARNTVLSDLAAAFNQDGLSKTQRSLLTSLASTVEHLASPESNILDLKIADAALKEMAEAFDVFRPYRHIKKLTMFGSARTERHDPIYELAAQLAKAIADNDWMVITGAGPGIMQAGIEGAGSERSFGVNILLPFEQGANPLIALDSKLVEMRYFFTRKLVMIKESDAYAVLPGGFGTLDEVFELLTLLQTGKAQPAPIVLVDTPGSLYWEGWQQFVREQAEANGYVSSDDDCLYRIVNSVAEVVDEIESFYRNYHSIRMVGSTMIVRCQVMPSKVEIEELNRDFSDLITKGAIEKTEPRGPERSSQDVIELPRLALHFDMVHYGRLRQFINRLNECVGK